MDNKPSQLQQMKPYLILSGILLVLISVVLLWPSKQNPPTETAAVADNSANSDVEVIPAKDPNANITDMVDPQKFDSVRTPITLDADKANKIEDFSATEIVEEIPVDTSDASVKSALMAISRSPSFGRLLVNNRLLDKFVINVYDLSNGNTSPKDALLQAPPQNLKTYKQANKTWIDSSSYARYTPYVEVLESFSSNELVEILSRYKDSIEQKFNEISRPNEDFDSALIKAIDALLAAPEIDYPIEVYSESVAYKFSDPALENLPGPHKQLIRTGPDNTQRIKAVMRKLKASLSQE